MGERRAARPRGLDVRRRLALVAAAGVLTAFTVGALSVLGALAVIRGHERVDAITEVATRELLVAELAESVRADVLAHGGGLRATADDGTGTHLSELRTQTAVLAGGPAQGLPAARTAVVAAALEVVADAERLLRTPSAQVRPADLEEFEQTSARLEELTGRRQTELAALARTQALRAQSRQAQIGGYLLVVGAAGVAVVVLVTVWATRRVQRTVAHLSSVARAVAAGDLTARVGPTGAGELGDLGRVFDDMADELEQAFVRLAEERAHQEFQSRLDRAFEHLDSEEDLSGVLARAMAVLAPAMPMELLVADSSESHVARMTVSETAGPACCPVDSPWACPAVRTGRSIQQRSSEDLDACPKLRGRAGGPHGAVCIPVSFMGRSLGVLHAAVAAGEDGGLPPAPLIADLRALAERTGSRLGTLRAFATAERQASTDPLTGLENRRSFEDRLRSLTSAGRGYALLLADLDRFKLLNDTYGHETGDRALRKFADVLRGTLRSGDFVARYGGEEFVIAIPDKDAEAGLQAAERLRAAVAAAVGGPDGPSFTVSIGVADSSMAATLATQLKIADAALLSAKRAGRDRCVLGTPDAALVRDGDPLLPPQRRSADEPVGT